MSLGGGGGGIRATFSMLIVLVYIVAVDTCLSRSTHVPTSKHYDDNYSVSHPRTTSLISLMSLSSCIYKSL